MSTTKSWGIIDSRIPTQRRSSPGSAARATSAPSRPQASHVVTTPEIRPRGAANAPHALQTAPVVDARSTGFFAVPEGDGNIIDLHVYLSSFADVPHRVAVHVDRRVGNERESVFSRVLEIPSGEARHLEIGDLDGQSVEVRVSAPAEIVATAAVTQYFLADGGILVLIFKAPSDFVQF